MILFVTIGLQPFQDSVSTIAPDGSHLKRILTPQRGKSYTYAAGNSLQKQLVVTVHELDATGQVVDHLYLYTPQTSSWRRLINKDGMEGAGYMAPDDSRVAFVFAPAGQPTQLRPWLTNLQSNETFKLTADDHEEGAWDGYFNWKPDGKEFTFLRLRRASSAGLTSTLMRIPASGGEPVEVLEPGEWVFAACYSPDGKRLAILTKAGLEIFEILTKRRDVLLRWDQLPTPQYRTGGLIWSNDTDTIAFSILNKQAQRYQLWTILSDGRNSRKIYEQDANEGQLTVTSFVRS